MLEGRIERAVVEFKKAVYEPASAKAFNTLLFKLYAALPFEVYKVRAAPAASREHLLHS